ncbi:cell division protein FtsA [Candidatus Aerophobetes bacterium]|nr:cell division protein FtsA [Candidatus Aerophobetes bacterium]
MREEKKNVIAGLDIGTSKICVIIGKAREDGLDILGSSITSSEGVQKGVITSINKVSGRIKRLMKNAELDAGRKVNKLWVSIAGSHIQGKDNQSFISIKGEEQIISKKDVDEALKKASSIALPRDREIIHTLTQDYIIDGQDQIKNPVGMRGAHLQLKVHLITASSGCCRNIEESVKNAGYEVEGLALQPLVSGISTLPPQEQELGVALLDIGGGTTDLAVFLREGLIFTKVIAVGGNHLTNDIAVGLHISREEAEKIKLRCGTASVDYLNKDEYLEVEGVAGRGNYRVKRSALVHIIQMRIEELFELVDLELKSSGYKGLITSGVVLTGGSSLLPGVKEKAEEKLALPARIGYPRIDSSTKIFSPVYATAVGLIFWGMKVRQELSLKERLDVKLKEWFKDFF